MPKKILYVLQGLGIGGVPSVILNYYRMLQNDIKADFVVIIPPEAIPRQISDELEESGCKIFHATPFVKNMRKYRQELTKIIDQGNYDIVHDNDKYFAFLSLKPAKKRGVPNRICHVHNMVAASEKGLFHRLFIKITSQLSMRYATALLACSDDAGKSMFGKHQYTVLNNAIDTQNFIYDEEKRNHWRESLGLHDRFVITMVARNDPLKRYDFAFSIFHELCKLKEDVSFMVVGMNEKECSRRDREALNSLPEDERKKVIFLGRRMDANELLNAADAFILTSEHEGFGISIIEAQANGLPCFVSDAIPHATKCTDLVSFLPTASQPEIWASAIIKAKTTNRKSYNEQIKNSEFSITRNKKVLESVYGEK